MYDGEYTDDDNSDGDEIDLLESPPDEQDEEAMPAEKYECNPELISDFNCLETVQRFVAEQKASASTNLLPFFVRMENMVSSERRRCRNMDKVYNRERKENASAQDDIAERSAFDVFEDNEFE